MIQGKPYRVLISLTLGIDKRPDSHALQSTITLETVGSKSPPRDTLVCAAISHLTFHQNVAEYPSGTFDMIPGTNLEVHVTFNTSSYGDGKDVRLRVSCVDNGQEIVGHSEMYQIVKHILRKVSPDCAARYKERRRAEKIKFQLDPPDPDKNIKLMVTTFEEVETRHEGYDQKKIDGIEPYPCFIQNSICEFEPKIKDVPLSYGRKRTKIEVASAQHDHCIYPVSDSFYVFGKPSEKKTIKERSTNTSSPNYTVDIDELLLGLDDTQRARVLAILQQAMNTAEDYRQSNEQMNMVGDLGASLISPFSNSTT